MKKTLQSSLFLTLILVSCINRKDENVNSFDNINSNIQQTNTKVNLKKQPPIFTPSEPSLPFSNAVQVGDILFLSGEIGIAEDGTGLVQGGIIPETNRIFERIKATLAHHELGLENIFKCTVMLTDMSEWQTFNEIYSGYFKPSNYPTRSAMGVNGLALGARVEIECWAYKP